MSKLVALKRSGAPLDDDDLYLTAVRDSKCWDSCAVGEALGLDNNDRPNDAYLQAYGARFSTALQEQDIEQAQALLDKINRYAYGPA